MMIKRADWIFVVVISSLVGMGCDAGLMRIEPDEQGFLFLEGDRQVMHYQRTPWQQGQAPARCNYIHPLWGLDGQVLTENAPADHLHHRGIFWPWHTVIVNGKRIGDGWLIQDIQWQVVDAKVIEQQADRATLQVKVDWLSPNWTDEQGRQKPFVEETTVIRLHRSHDQIQMIDFEISLRALADKVEIGGSEDAKAYSGFSLRAKLPEGVRFIGRGGEVTPETLAVEAGPWVDFSGDFGGIGQTSGIAILCHRSTPGYPQTWLLRRKASMQNAKWPGRVPILLSKEEPYVLRYRLVIHRGDGKDIDIDNLQEAYNALACYR